MKYLPSKKVVTTLFLVLVLLFGVFLFSDKKTIQNQNLSGIFATSNGTVDERIAEEDSDDDGLADWEEVLWKTNPFNQDTDGDGTYDGEEVSLNRNPNLKGPDDFLENIDLIENRELIAVDENLTKTGTVAVELLSKYLNIKNRDRDLSEEETTRIQNALVNSFLLDLGSGKSLPIFFSKDVTTVETNESNLKNYGNLLGAIIIRYEQKESHGDPLEILTEALQKRSEDKADGLKILAEDYILAANEIIKIPTPDSLVSLHLSLVNNLISIGENVSVMGNILSDPLSSLGSLSLYIDNANLLTLSVNDLREYMALNKVSYTPTEAGYVLINGI